MPLRVVAGAASLLLLALPAVWAPPQAPSTLGGSGGAESGGAIPTTHPPGYPVASLAAGASPGKVPWLRQLQIRSARVRGVPHVGPLDGIEGTAISLAAPLEVQLTRSAALGYVELVGTGAMALGCGDRATSRAPGGLTTRLLLSTLVKERRFSIEPAAGAVLAEARLYECAKDALPDAPLAMAPIPRQGDESVTALSTGPLAQATGVTAVVVEVELGAPLRIPLRVRLTQSSEAERAWFQADLHLQAPEGSTGGRWAIVLDPPDTWCEAGESITLSLSPLPETGADASDAKGWAAPRVRARVVTGTADEVRVEFALSRLQWLGAWHAAHAVDAPWDRPGWSLDAEPAAERWLEALRRWQPQHPATMAYTSQIRHVRREARVPAVGPANAPAWARLARQLLKRTQDVAYWWNSARYQKDGLYGGDPAEDAALVEKLATVPLIAGHPVLLRSTQAGCEGFWQAARSISEAGTGADPDAAVAAWVAAMPPEERGRWLLAVTRTQSLLMLADPGNAVALRRCLPFAHLLSEWTGANTRGHRHFGAAPPGPPKVGGGRTTDYGLRTTDYGSGPSSEVSSQWSVVRSPTAFLGPPKVGGDRGGSAALTSVPPDVPGNVVAAGPALALFWHSGHPVLGRVLGEWATAWAGDILNNIDPEQPGRLPTGVDPISCRVDTTGPRVSARDERGLRRFLLDAHRFTGNRDLLRPVALAVDAGDADPMTAALWRAQGHADHDERIVRAARGADDLRAYAAWVATRNKQFVVEGLQQALDRLETERYLVTEANLPPEALDVPGDLLIRALYLGGCATWQGGMPRVAVTWEKTGVDFAAFVTESRRDALKVLLYHFRPEERPVQMRVWALRPGTYVLEAGPDDDYDDAPDRVTDRRLVEVERGGALPLTLPAQRPYVLRLTAKSLRPDVPTPDVALCADEVTLSPDRRRVTVTVRNFGTAPAAKVRLSVTDAHRQVIGSAVVEQVPWPHDLMPALTRAEVPLTVPAPVAFRVTAALAGPELSTGNNSVAVHGR